MASRDKPRLLELIRRVPSGRVTSADALAEALAVPTAVVVGLLSQLSDDEREIVPWHRVVAKGGAIGRGPHRDAQFARLVREGIMVSPAGIVQDLPRTMVAGLDQTELRTESSAETATPGSRSRGMKQRP
jgi:methylated-DNA-protein-cysteine methyltransferase-like protein